MARRTRAACGIQPQDQSQHQQGDATRQHKHEWRDTHALKIEQEHAHHQPVKMEAVQVEDGQINDQIHQPDPPEHRQQPAQRTEQIQRRQQQTDHDQQAAVVACDAELIDPGQCARSSRRVSQKQRDYACGQKTQVEREFDLIVEALFH